MYLIRSAVHRTSPRRVFNPGAGRSCTIPDAAAQGRAALDSDGWGLYDPAATWQSHLMYSNGNSFSEGNSFITAPACPREPWYIRLLSAIQDRGQT